jgi:hypothetical protein
MPSVSASVDTAAFFVIYFRERIIGGQKDEKIFSV